MIKSQKTTTLTSIDIGTYKVCTALVSLASGNADCETTKVINSCCRRTKGIRGSTITNLVHLTNSILETIIDIERQSQYQVRDVYIAIPRQFTIIKRRTKTFLFGDNIVSEKHINDFLNAARKASASPDLEVLHIFVTQYLIDDSLEVQNPVGMMVNKLQVVVHIIYGLTSFTKTVRRELNQQNINVVAFVLSQYASALSTTYQDEKHDGVTIIDIGHESTTILYIIEDNIYEMHSIDVGGHQITKDIASSLNMVSENDAEVIKTTRAYATTERYIYNMFTNQDEMVQYKTIDKNNNIYTETTSIKKINSIVSSGLDNLFAMINTALSKSKYPKILNRIIITGGGSKIGGLHEFITSRRIFKGSKFRIGNPIGINCSTQAESKTASFASSAGLAIYAKQNDTYNQEYGHGFINFFKRIFGAH